MGPAAGEFFATEGASPTTVSGGSLQKGIATLGDFCDSKHVVAGNVR